jgi:hypothetical protein
MGDDIGFVLSFAELPVVRDDEVTGNGGDGNSRPNFRRHELGRQLRINSDRLELALDGELDGVVPRKCVFRNVLEKTPKAPFIFTN